MKVQRDFSRGLFSQSARFSVSGRPALKGYFFFFFLGDNAGVHRYHQSHQSRCRVGIGQDVCRRRRPFGVGVGVGLKGDTDTDDSSWVVGVGGGGGRPRFTRVHVRDRVSFVVFVFVVVVVFVVVFFVFVSAPVGGDRGCWSCGVLCCVEVGEADAWDGD